MQNVDCNLLEYIACLWHCFAILNQAHSQISSILHNPELNKLVEQQISATCQQHSTHHHLQLQWYLQSKLDHLADALENYVGKTLALLL